MFVQTSVLVRILIVDLLATSGDITASWTSPMYPKLYSNDSSINPLDRPITPDEDSWIGSLINIGAFIGAVPAGYLADRIGRKNLLIAIAIPHIVSYITFAFAKSVTVFYLIRLLNGISEGAGYAILPMYIAEVTEDSNRAALSVTLNIFWTLGNFLPYAIGPYLSVRLFNLILASVPCIFLIGFLLTGIETPHYLVHTGRLDDAKRAIITLRSCQADVAEKEIENLKELLKEEEGASMMDIVKTPALRKALFISIMLIIFQQIAGVNAIFYYLEPIFNATGSKLSGSLSSTICGLAAFIFSFSTTFIIERTGKKWLLGISFFGLSLSLVFVGVFFYVKDETSHGIEHIQFFPLIGVIGYTFFFNLALGPIPWTISSELFPNNVKAISSSTVSACSWLSSFFVTKYFNLLIDILGTARVFWLFSGSCIAGVFFVIFFVPETKGKSFAEIQDMLKS